MFARFFFWGCLKDKIYNSNPRTAEELKENIHREITNIPEEQLQRVTQNLFRRCEECLRAEGQHFQHLLRSVNKGTNFLSFRMSSAFRHADSSAPVAVKRGAMEAVNKVKILPVYTMDGNPDVMTYQNNLSCYKLHARWDEDMVQCF
jgi:hypothetical protein